MPLKNYRRSLRTLFPPIAFWLLVGLIPCARLNPIAGGQELSQTAGVKKRKITYGSRELRPMLYRAIMLAEEDKYDEAIRLENDALQLVEKERDPDQLSISILLEEIGFLQYSKGAYPEAETSYQRAFDALNQWRESLPMILPTQDQSPLTIDKLSEDKRLHRSLLYAATDRAAQALSIMGGIDRDREKSFIQVSDYLSENDKLKYMANIEQELELMISCQVRLAPNSEEAASLALTAVLRRKGRVLDALSGSLTRLRQQLSDGDLKTIKQLIDVRAELASLSLKGSTDSEASQHEAEIARLASLSRSLEQALGERSAKYRVFWQPVTLKLIQQAIPSNAALLEVVLYRPFNAQATTNASRWEPPHYIVYALKHDGPPTWTDLGLAGRIDSQILKFRALLKMPVSADIRSLSYKNNVRAVKLAARALDEMVMKPVRQRLVNTRQVFISPDGSLNLLPFGALVDEKNRYLIENYSISYLTSGRDLLSNSNVTSHRHSSPVVFAYPAFEDEGKSNFSMTEEGCSASADGTNATPGQRAAATTSTGASRAREGAGEGFDEATISNTLTEAQDLCSLLTGVRLYTGKRATEAALKDVSGPSILHIATHGFFRPDTSRASIISGPKSVWSDLAMYDPAFSAMTPALPVENVLLRSGLALAGANHHQSFAGQDGILTALEASGLDLWGTQLVVLSACSTGLGDIRNGEGVYGLRRALVEAGSESQIVSLWNVNDEATRVLMIDYYKRILRMGEGRSEALRAAQLNMISAKGLWSHPYYWSSFIESGAWSPLEATLK